MARRSKRQLLEEQPFPIAPELERDMVAIDQVRTLEGNARRGDIEAIKESIRENGLYRAPVARRETGEILVNNHTVMAAEELGATALPIDWRSIEDDDAARAIAIADNRTSDLAKYDHGKLAHLLERQAESKRGLRGTGYDRDAFTAAINRAEGKLDLAEPEPQARPEKPRSRKGRTYTLGHHRLVCGDSRDPKVLDRALGGETADMVWTDPPYGVDLHEVAAERGRDHGDMVGDGSAGELEALLAEVLPAALERTRAGGAIYLCHGDTRAELVHRALRETGWSFRQQLVWVKDRLVLGRQDYQWRHEAIAYGWRPGAHRWYGAFDKTTVIENGTYEALQALDPADLVEIAWRLLEERPGTVIHVQRPGRAELHPTAKPVRLVAAHLRNSSPAGGLVLDPFAGAGSTLLAAEQTDRRAALVEIDPGYCDVIRRRWEELNEEHARPT